MTHTDTTISGRFVAALTVTLAFWASATAAASVVVEHPSGLRLVIHDAATIRDEMIVSRGEALFLLHEAVGELELLTGPQDPRQARPGVDCFHPYEPDRVRRALDDLHGFGADARVDVFLLPTPPAVSQGSFARGGAILLSPGYGPVPVETTAYVLVHELGHVLCNVFLDPSPRRWADYLRLRDLDPRDDNPDVPHARRPREIFAEDFRYLFGGTLAAGGGTIENAALDPPDRIVGLSDFLVRCFASRPRIEPTVLAALAYPNPCNPQTLIRLEVPEGGELGPESTLRMYDVAGRLVRTLRDGRWRGSVLGFQWGGRDDDGRLVASGRYFYRIRTGRVEGRGSVVVVR